MYRPGALQSKCRPCEPETRKGKEDACFFRAPHFLSGLCVAGRFLVFFIWWLVDSAARKLNRGRKRKRWGDGGGGTRGEGSEENRLQTCKQPRKSNAVNGIPDWPTECQLVHKNFKGVLSVVMRLTLFAFAQKKIQYFDQYLARQLLQF